MVDRAITGELNAQVSTLEPDRVADADGRSVYGGSGNQSVVSRPSTATVIVRHVASVPPQGASETLVTFPGTVIPTRSASRSHL